MAPDATLRPLSSQRIGKITDFVLELRPLHTTRIDAQEAQGDEIVPGGAVGPGEDPAAAVMREAREETGLADLALVAFLGEAFRTMDVFPDDFAPGEVHHRFFYHLECEGEPPSAWRRHERFATGGDGRPIAFDFFWAALPDDIPPLIAGQDACIPQLVKSLSER